MTRRLPRALVAAINDSPILGVRAGAATDHRVTASLKYVRGFRTKRRRETTIEFVPRERRA